jgi:hypothetical protein
MNPIISGNSKPGNTCIKSSLNGWKDGWSNESRGVLLISLILTQRTVVWWEQLPLVYSINEDHFILNVLRFLENSENNKNAQQAIKKWLSWDINISIRYSVFLRLSSSCPAFIPAFTFITTAAVGDKNRKNPLIFFFVFLCVSLWLKLDGGFWWS